MNNNKKKKDDLDLLLDKLNKDPGFRKEWDDTEAEYQLGRQIIQARIDQRISQRELAKRTKTTQAVISRIESMVTSPTLRMTSRLARAMGKKLEIKFVDA